MHLDLAQPALNGITDVRFVDQSNGYLFAPGLFQTHDGGVMWQQAVLPVTQITDLAVTGDYAYALAATGQANVTWSLWRNAIGTNNWTSVPIPTATGQVRLYAGAGTLLLLQIGDGSPAPPMSTPGQLWSSSDGGTDWTARTVPCIGDDGEAILASIALDHPGAWLVDCFNGEQSSEAQRTQHHLYGTADSGASWVRLGDPSEIGDPVSLADDGAGRAVLAVETGGVEILMTTDNSAVKWAPSLTIMDAEFGWADLSFVNASTGFVVGPIRYAAEHLYRTEDGGHTWHAIPIPGGP